MIILYTIRHIIMGICNSNNKINSNSNNILVHIKSKIWNVKNHHGLFNTKKNNKLYYIKQNYILQ